MTPRSTAPPGGRVPVFFERGTRRVFACSLEWPGWCRSGKSPEAALDALAAYIPRYRKALVAGSVTFPFDGETVHFDVVEERSTGMSADFGTLDGVPDSDRVPVLRPERQRAAAILAASWAYFDLAVGRAPLELRKGPRGGGRDRDAIAAHVIGAEISYARKMGLSRHRATWEDRDGVLALRDEIAAAVAAGDGPDRPGGTGRPDLPDRPARPDRPGLLAEKRWPARTGARRVAWHVLDHAWEIEDRVL